MRLYPLFVAACFAVSVLPSGAEELRTAPIAVVELFTSQGCSSCPPADALLSKIGARPDVIALAYHVDYWDYIGWTDTFGNPAFSDYQRAYAAARGEKRIYTPQMMINGQTDVVGSRAADVERTIAGASLPLVVKIARQNDMLTIDIAADARFGPAGLWLVTYKQSAQVAISKGENENRQIDYTHVVTQRQILGMWEPDTGARLKLPLIDLLGPNSDGAAIIVQQDRRGLPGRILGASSFSQ